MSKNMQYTMTPLGAAIVEAMPNDKLVKRIKQNFKRDGTCPASKIFTTKRVKKFYSKPPEPTDK